MYAFFYPASQVGANYQGLSTVVEYSGGPLTGKFLPGLHSWSITNYCGALIGLPFCRPLRAGDFVRDNMATADLRFQFDSIDYRDEVLRRFVEVMTEMAKSHATRAGRTVVTKDDFAAVAGEAFKTVHQESSEGLASAGAAGSI